MTSFSLDFGKNTSETAFLRVSNDILMSSDAGNFSVVVV